MRENDGRKLSHETLEQIRIHAVQRVEAGESPSNVIRTLGFSRGRIYEWLAAYRGGGVEAWRAKLGKLGLSLQRPAVRRR
jgi:transposase